MRSRSSNLLFFLSAIQLFFTTLLLNCLFVYKIKQSLVHHIHEKKETNKKCIEVFMVCFENFLMGTSLLSDTVLSPLSAQGLSSKSVHLLFLLICCSCPHNIISMLIMASGIRNCTGLKTNNNLGSLQNKVKFIE